MLDNYVLKGLCCVVQLLAAPYLELRTPQSIGIFNKIVVVCSMETVEQYVYE